MHNNHPTPTNPLAGLMRQPKIYVKLPSNGRYWPSGSLDITDTGEYPVFSMTARDELLLKTPDALLNGQAVVDVVQSCMPNIKNAWDIPSIDMDSILIGIRLATYGTSMDINIKVAGEEAAYPVDLRLLLDQLSSTIKWVDSITLKEYGIVIYTRPLSYKDQSKNNIETFETQRILGLVGDSELSEEEKLKLFKQSFDKLSEVTIGTIIKSVYRIDTTNGIVVDPVFIKDFIENCDTKIFNEIKVHLDNLREQNTIKPLRVKASEEMIAAGAAEELEIPIVFDASNFFGHGF